jgi:polyphosphate kinase
VFYFRAGDHEELYLSSADWMNRNMLRRIELAWPVSEPAARQRIIDECLVPYLLDDTDAWVQKPDGHYERLMGLPGQGTRSAQAALMALHRHRHVSSLIA